MCSQRHVEGGGPEQSVADMGRVFPLFRTTVRPPLVRGGFSPVLLKGTPVENGHLDTRFIVFRMSVA